MNRRNSKSAATEATLGGARPTELVDPKTGEVHHFPTPPVPYAFQGPHAQVDKERVEAITESTAFTPAEKFFVLWWIGASPAGMEPLHLTGADIAKRVGMKPDSVGRINRKLARHRILIKLDTIGNYPLYRISPYIAYHGTGAEQREAITRFNPPDIPKDKGAGQAETRKKRGEAA